MTTSIFKQIGCVISSFVADITIICRLSIYMDN